MAKDNNDAVWPLRQQQLQQWTCLSVNPLRVVFHFKCSENVLVTMHGFPAMTGLMALCKSHVAHAQFVCSSQRLFLGAYAAFTTVVQLQFKLH